MPPADGDRPRKPPRARPKSDDRRTGAAGGKGGKGGAASDRRGTGRPGRNDDRPRRSADDRSSTARPRRPDSEWTPRSSARPARPRRPDDDRAPGSGARAAAGRPRRPDSEWTPRSSPRRPDDDRPSRPRSSDDRTPGARPRRPDDDRTPDSRSAAGRPRRPDSEWTPTSGARPARPRRPDDDRTPRPPRTPGARSVAARPRRPDDSRRDSPSTGDRPYRARRADAGLEPEARRAVARGRAPEQPVNKKWGSVARRGARVVGEPREGSASEAWREVVDRERAAPEAWAPEVWIKEPAPDTKPKPKSKAEVQSRARARPQSTQPARRRGARLPAPVKEELGKANRRLAPKLEQRLAEAVRAYEADRYQDARRILCPLAESTPDAAAVRELYGLTLYRLNRWLDALKELDAFHALTGSYDQHPVRMDAYRALKRWRRVEELWAELREASPGADVVAEGRIVAAGALADRGRLAEAIQVLERVGAEVKRPKLHHLRTWYALADLYERAGEIPRARTLFTAVLRHDAEFADVAERLAALG